MLMTKNQAEKWFDNSLGKQFNPDGWYGFQCYDYANMFFMLATGERLQGLYAYNIPFDNKAKIEKYGQIIKNYDSFYRKSWILSFSRQSMVAELDTLKLLRAQI